MILHNACALCTDPHFVVPRPDQPVNKGSQDTYLLSTNTYNSALKLAHCSPCPPSPCRPPPQSQNQRQAYTSPASTPTAHSDQAI
jgi:hypothetical protein